MAESTTTETPVVHVNPNFSLEILPHIKTVQNQNGLRRAEYRRYKLFCAVRLRRIRKGAHFLHGRSKFVKKFVEVKDVKDKRILEMVLMQAERAWAAAMEWKEDEGNPRARYHTARRLSKAVLWAEKLKGLCESCGDSQTQLEAQAYSAWMKSNELFESEKWKEVTNCLREAKTIYEQIGKVVSPDKSEFYSLRVEELTTLFRYAISKADPAAMVDGDSLRSMMSLAADDPALKLLQGKLGSVIEANQRQRADQVTQIAWQGRQITLKSPALRLAFVKALETTTEVESMSSNKDKSSITATATKPTESDLNTTNTTNTAPKSHASSLGSKLAAYDRLLQAWSDVKLKIRDERAAALQTNRTDSMLDDLALLMAYATYTEQTQMMIRNLLLVGSIEKKIDSVGLDNLHTVKPDEAVRLYELALQLLSENEQIRASGNTNATETAQDAKTYKALFDGRELGYKSLRCYYLALTYAQLAKWAEAVALLNRSSDYAETAQKFIATQDAKLSKRLNAVLVQIRAALIWIQAKAALADSTQQPLFSTSSSTETTSSVNILSDLKSWDASYAKHHIVDFPSAPEPMAAKPVLFDLAFAGFQAPDLSQKAKAPKTGFFSSFWRS